MSLFDIEAITGKGNFDIGEYILLRMLKCFDKHNGAIAFLIKNSVIKNIIQDQQRNKFRISQSEKMNIDSKREFKVSVNACLFVTHLNFEPDFTCKEFDFYSRETHTIFGVGDYSLAPFKIAISGLYKSTHFTLVSPFDNKPIMLDGTCYFIGFKEFKMAQIAHFLVNSRLVQKFLKSIIFADSKRSINKDILMRIDFEKVFENTNYERVKEVIKNLNEKDWEDFGSMIKKNTIEQVKLFS